MKLQNVIFFCLLIYATICQEPNTQNFLSGATGLNDDSVTLRQIITYFRHGAHVDKAMFYKTEYEGYGAAWPFLNTMTYLGLAQTWSYGAELRNLYPEFFEDFDQNDDLYVIADLKKSFDSVQALAAAVRNNYPEWDYSSIMETAIDGIEVNGKCEGCETYFPIADLVDGTLSNETDYSRVRINIHYDDNLLDVDKYCGQLVDQQEDCFETTYDEFIVDPGYESDYENYWDGLIKSSEIKLTYYSHFEVYLFNIWYYHDQHGLPEYDVGNENIANLQNIDVYTEWQQEMYSSLFRDDLFYARFYCTELFKKTLWHLYGYGDSYFPLITYMVHDNNLYAIAMLLFEDDRFVCSAANIRIEVWEYDESGEIYINLYYNNELMMMTGCDENGYDCPLDTFAELITDHYVEPLKYCEDVDTSLPDPEKSQKNNCVKIS